VDTEWSQTLQQRRRLRTSDEQVVDQDRDITDSHVIAGRVTPSRLIDIGLGKALDDAIACPSDKLGIDHDTNIADRGFIPHVKLGRLVRFREAAVVEWVEKRSQLGRATRRRSMINVNASAT